MEKEGELSHIDPVNVEETQLLHIFDAKLAHPLITIVEQFLTLEDRCRLRATCSYLNDVVRGTVLNHDNMVIDIISNTVSPSFNRAGSLTIADFLYWKDRFASRINLRNMVLRKNDDAVGNDVENLLEDVTFQSLYIITTNCDESVRRLQETNCKKIVLVGDSLSDDECMSIPVSTELRLNWLDGEHANLYYHNIQFLLQLVRRGLSICLTSFATRGATETLLPIFEAIASSPHDQFLAIKVGKQELRQFFSLIGVRKRGQSTYELMDGGRARNLQFHEETHEDGRESWSFKHGEKMFVNVDDGLPEMSVVCISNFSVIMGADGCRMNCKLCTEMDESRQSHVICDTKDDSYDDHTNSCAVCPVCCKVNFVAEVFHE